MIITTITSYLPYALITTFTPGPNNLIAFYSVSSYGWKQGSRVIAGIGTAIMTTMLIAALCCHQLSTYIDLFLPIIKYLGAAYILWLSVQIIKSSPDNSTLSICSYWKGFLLVFINVKMLLYEVTIFGGYIVTTHTNLSTLLIHAIFLTGLCVLSNLIWAAAGSALQSFLNKHYRKFNIIMGGILIYCAISLALS
jgi:cysteine/O-acetylserine efflux protein